jgi:transcriptional/translational regulatory protein YebC/TACO1
MPKDNIQRAIDKATKGGGDNYEEIRYEGYGPGGVALIVEALTDNRNRTATNVRTAFSKNGGNLGASGAVSHGFDRLGLIEYPARRATRTRCSKPRSRRAPTMSKATATAIRSGPRWTRCTKSPRNSRRAGRGRSVKLAWKPSLTVEVGEGDAGTLFKLIDALDDDDDVQTVWGNYEVSDEVMEKLG